MKLYCPVCLNQTLKLSQSGIVQLSLNHKQLPTSRFLYNLEKDSGEQIDQYLFQTLEDLFKWYGSFKNKNPITSLEIWTSSMVCKTGCLMPAGLKQNVIGLLYTESFIKNQCLELAKKYQLILALAE